MKYLIKLARFVSKSETQYITSQLEKLFQHSSNQSMKGRITKIKSRRLYLETQKPLKHQLLSKITHILGVWQIIEIYFTKRYTSLQQVIEQVHDFFIQKQPNVSGFSLESQFHHGAKFHELAFKQRFSSAYPKISISSDIIPEQHYYLEATGNRLTWGRFLELQYREDLQELEIALILIDPYSKHEIADFIRLGVVFKTPVYICYNHQKKQTLQRLVEGAKKMVRGWQKTNVSVTTFSAISNNFWAIGLSMWSNKDSQDLIEDINNRLDSLEEKNITKATKKPTKMSIGFIFGNERYGLNFEVRKLLQQHTYRLGPQSSEPLKASQAAAYILGILFMSFH